MRTIVNLGLLLMLLTLCCWMMPRHQEVEFEGCGFEQPRRGVGHAFQHCLESFGEFLVAIADLHIEATRPMEFAPEPIRAGFGTTLLGVAAIIALGSIVLLVLLKLLDRLL